jgi:hypothetical protein
MNFNDVEKKFLLIIFFAILNPHFDILKDYS